MNKRWLNIMLILFGAASYGLLSPMIKLAYSGEWKGMQLITSQTTMGMQITSSQMTMGTVMIWLLVAVMPSTWANPFRGPWIRLALNGIIGLALTNLFINAALLELDATLCIVLLFQFTWITVLLDAWFNKKLPNRYQWFAIAIILAGTLLAVGISGVGLASVSLKGIFLGLASAVSYSCLLFFTGRIETTLHPLMKSAFMLTAALPMIYIFQPPNFFFQPGGGTLVLWGLLLGILGQVIPTVLFNISIPKVGSSLSAMLGAVELPVAMITAFLLLKDHIFPMQWVGMVVIIGGILVSEKKMKVVKTLD
ncbi:MAG: EamA family transporter [Gorillibacterium sp.]|nr:EamA family transporter [Gorillibacterium sp.]